MLIPLDSHEPANPQLSREVQLRRTRDLRLIGFVTPNPMFTLEDGWAFHKGDRCEARLLGGSRWRVAWLDGRETDCCDCHNCYDRSCKAWFGTTC